MSVKMKDGMKMKGLLKGLRYISQIFEEEEEGQEIQIGLPTDVKHVAHIGWDGQAANSTPSWMNEFKGENQDESEEAPKKAKNEDAKDSGNKKVKTKDKDVPALPKASRRNPSMDSTGSADSPPGSPDRHVTSACSRSKDKDSSSKLTRRRAKGKDVKDKDSKETSTRGGSSGRVQKESSSASTSPKGVTSNPDDPNSTVPNLPKKTRRKASKDDGGSVTRSSRSKDDGGSVRSRNKGSHSGSIGNDAGGGALVRSKRGSRHAAEDGGGGAGNDNISGLSTLQEEAGKY